MDATGATGPRFRGDPAELYRVHADAAEELAGGQPVMLVALDGYVDAGSGVALAVRELLRALPHNPAVTFDADALVDYRSRRPTLTFSSNSFTEYGTPELVIHRMRDEAGVPFLLFSGPEPDLSWEKFVAAVGQVVDLLGVRLTISLMAIPMGVPHTRPTGMSAHATDPGLIPDATNWIGTVQVPGHATGLLEYRFGEAGRAALGFAAHVPHYLARTEYPETARTLIQAAADASGLLLPTSGLDEAAAGVQAQLAEQIAEHGEVAEVVQALERQYDAFVSATGQSLLAQSAPLPTADELGAQFEAYLANREPGDGTS
ncbi:MAG TPA: PAC2 family protein [Nakamurella sp.]|nr:PAC2 family protein [Nakamurella sp.]